MIRPKKVGRSTIKITATAPSAGDGIERVLPVEPEGTPQYHNKAVFIDLREKSSHESNFTIEIPRNAVPDSTRIEVAALGMCALCSGICTFYFLNKLNLHVI